MYTSLKKGFAKIAIFVNKWWYQYKIPKTSGEFWIRPKPQFLSQFIVSPPKNSSSTQLLANQKLIEKFGAKNAKDYTFWSWRACGITCVAMLLGKRSPSIMKLITEGLSLSGYDIPSDTGWYHSALANLLIKYGTSAKTNKYESGQSVVNHILHNQAVIASVRKYTGHLFLVIGTKLSKGQIDGFWVHDPGLGQTAGPIWVSSEEFAKIFTGRTIYTL